MVGRSTTEKIWDIRGGLIQTAQDLSIKIEELSYEDTDKIRLSVSQKYCGREKSDHLWRSTGYHNISAHRNFEGDGYRLIGSFVKQNKAIIFFNKEDERAGFIFQSGSDFIKLLDEWLFYDLYVTDNELSYFTECLTELWEVNHSSGLQSICRMC